jgi:hypothetical protein
LALWYNLRLFATFGIFFPVLVCCSKKNLASLRRHMDGATLFERV